MATKVQTLLTYGSGFRSFECFCPGDIDKNFRSINQNILVQKMGSGLWFWKLFTIWRMRFNIPLNECLPYMEIGAVPIKSIKKLRKMTKLHGADIIE